MNPSGLQLGNLFVQVWTGEPIEGWERSPISGSAQLNGRFVITVGIIVDAETVDAHTPRAPSLFVPPLITAKTSLLGFDESQKDHTLSKNTSQGE